VKKFTYTCLQCEKSVSAGTVPRPWGITLKGSRRNEVIAMDYLNIGPPPLDSRHQFKYILAIKDTYSHFCRLIAAKSADSNTAAQAFMDWIGIFGNSTRYLVSDQGSHFKNKLMHRLQELFGMKQHFTVAYSAWANGSVENLNKEIVRVLTILAAENGLSLDDWPWLLPLVEDIVNSHISKVLGNKCPREIMMGLPPSNPVRAMLDSDPALVKPLEVPTTDQYLNAVADLYTKFEDFHEKKEVAAAKKQAENEKSQKLVSEMVNFSEGDYVLYAKVKTSKERKLQVTWKGPYRVKTVVDDYVYSLEHLIDSSKNVNCVHSTRLKFYAPALLDVTTELLDSICWFTDSRVYRKSRLNKVNYKEKILFMQTLHDYTSTYTMLSFSAFHILT
jgi:hypothetical protein